MKDTIMLEGRTFICRTLVQAMFGIDHQTLAKMEKAEQMPSPVKLGNKLFYERDLIERQILATCRV